MNAKRTTSNPAAKAPVLSVSSRFAARLSVVIAAGAFVSAAAVHADWLVLREGGSVETRGAWKVEGPKVVYTSTRGVLSSVRASEIDVDASRALTAKKSEEATKGASTATPAPKRTPVLVLTDKDFEKAPPADAAAAGDAAAVEGEVAAEGAAEGAEGAAPQGEASVTPAEGAPPQGENGAGGGATTASSAQGSASAGSTSAASSSAQASEAGGAAGSATTQRQAAGARGVAVPKQPIVVPSADSLETRVAHQMPGPPALRVASWSARPTGEDQLSIFGSVVNRGNRVTAAINVAVTLFDSEGERVGSTEALVSSTALMPNAQADFEARFADDPNFAEVQFTLKTVELELGEPADGEELDEPVGDEPHATGRTGARPRS